jgi:hypothetical protein
MNKASCGLGLVISKALSIELGGDIVVESEISMGSTFSIFIREEKEALVSMNRFFTVDFQSPTPKNNDEFFNKSMM